MAQGLVALYKDQQSKMKQLFDKKRRDVDDQKFKEGQLVLLQVKNQPRTQLASPGKFGVVWARPYPIAAVLPYGVYRLQLPAGVNIGATFHASVLKLYQCRRTEGPCMHL